MNVYGLQKKADQSMCTVQARNCFIKHDSRNTKVRVFQKENKNFLGFHVVASTRENLSNHVPIATVGLILTKLWRFQHFRTSQNKIRIQFRPFLKKKSNVRVFIL